MTDIEQYEPSADLVVSEKVHELRNWAESARAAHLVAESLVRTSFVPETFRGKAGEATAAILAGNEIGLSPMAALQSFDIIQGRAAPRAVTLRAVVQAQGHEVWIEESSPTRVVVKGKRKDSDKEQVSEWDLDRARGLNLLSRDNWKKQPKAMLIARATAECCRLVASDAILGIPYAAEELADESPARPIRATTKRVTAAEITAEPESDDDMLRPDDPDLTAHMPEGES